MFRTQQRWALDLVGLLALGLAGCGTPAAPLPPSLNLPVPATGLTAARVGDTVRLTWTMPTRTTDKVTLRGAILVQVCRAIEGGPCASVTTLSFAAGAAGNYADDLPAALTQGPDRLLRYEVAVRNHAGKSAGPSDPAWSVAGVSPPALTGLAGEARADGVLLTWQPAPEPGRALVFRIGRLQTSDSTVEPRLKSPLAPATLAAAQTLVVRAQPGADPGHAIDAAAVFNQQYRYVLERVATADLFGHVVEVQGPPSQPLLVSTTDHFAPAVPAGLAAVADTTGGAIDLSWIPDTDSDLAAYHVYRRDTHGGGPPQAIAVVPAETSYHDAAGQPEHTYAYSVSASDQSSNESSRSAEAEETFPGPLSESK